MRAACIVGLLPRCSAVKGIVIPHATGMTLGQLAGVAQQAVRNRLDSGSGVRLIITDVAENSVLARRSS